jgi:arylsulfatase A-like enzyme
VYDTTIHVPLIVSRPGAIPASAQCDTLLSTLDIGPTLCRLAGIEPPASFEGTSFMWALVEGEAHVPAENPVYSEGTMPWHVEEGAARPNMNKAKCVRSGAFKLIDFPYVEGGRRELYNMEDDPLERSNLLDDPGGAPVAEGLEEILDRWAKNYRNVAREIKPMDEETLKKLEDLGYTGR